MDVEQLTDWLWCLRTPVAARPGRGDALTPAAPLGSGVVSDDEHDVLAAERALQAAQRASDVAALDRLLHPNLLAVGPDGSLADKAADLEAHRTGVFTIAELEEEELEIRALGDAAVTFVVLRVRGTIGDDEVSGRMRYTRTWVRDGGGWRVIAAHIAPAAA